MPSKKNKPASSADKRKPTKFNLGEARIPPQNIEAEMSVLGSLMLDKNAIIKIADLVHPDDFYKDANKFVYETMLELYEEREPIDVLRAPSGGDDGLAGFRSLPPGFDDAAAHDDHDVEQQRG